ncbi:diaminopimelate epimerase [Sphingomonas sp. Tas61C01]|uniref:diaminopimelate epimerase n=1 Tax=Sphingomonas sp. Tas61C01 TaxID=3458297 RepID=UPI00403EE1B5
MRFDVVKCHGSGNDFPMIDARAIVLDDTAWAAVARALADRAGPIGGDGLLLLGEGREGTAFAMRMFNSDGSEAETCLNGLRCVARLGFAALGVERGDVALKTSVATVEHVGDLAPAVYTVRETAGPASLDAAAWPLHGATTRIVDAPIAALPGVRRYTAVAMPNPHLVCFVDAIDDAELGAVGAVCEAAPDWLPNRANVSFVERRGDDLFVRTFERGVGLTDSCGSAMGASIYAAGITGRVPFGRDTMVFNRGGLVRASASADGMVTLMGNATVEWRGAVTVDLDSAVATDLTIDERADDEVAAWAAAVAALSTTTEYPT